MLSKGALPGAGLEERTAPAKTDNSTRARPGPADPVAAVTPGASWVLGKQKKAEKHVTTEVTEDAETKK